MAAKYSLTARGKVISIMGDDETEEFYQLPGFDTDDEGEMSYNNEDYGSKDYFKLSDFEEELTETQLATYYFDTLLVMPQIDSDVPITQNNFKNWYGIFSNSILKAAKFLNGANKVLTGARQLIVNHQDNLAEKDKELDVLKTEKNNELAKLAKEKEKLNKYITDSNTATLTMKSESEKKEKELKDNLAVKDKELDELKTKNEKLICEAKSISDSDTRTTGSVQKSKNEQDELKTKLALITQENEKLTASNSGLKSESEKKEKELKENLAMKDKELDELKTKLEVKEHSLHKANDDLQGKNDEIKELKARPESNISNNLLCLFYLFFTHSF
jgi:hypothetical protein